MLKQAQGGAERVEVYLLPDELQPLVYSQRLRAIGELLAAGDIDILDCEVEINISLCMVERVLLRERAEEFLECLHVDNLGAVAMLRREYLPSDTDVLYPREIEWHGP